MKLLIPHFSLLTQLKCVSRTLVELRTPPFLWFLFSLWFLWLSVAQAVTEEMVREYVLPRTCIGEPEVAWEPVLKPIAERLAKGAKTNLEAAMQINRGLSEATGVIYSTQREAARQDPLHSIRTGMASCTGLSILLADACRSIGIPARLVGCFWAKKPGNHTWVEIWSDGVWYPLGAFEDAPPEKLWFLEDAAQAIKAHLKYAIYATRATPSPAGTIFVGWGVPADNVTERYVRRQAETPSCVYVAAEVKGRRVAKTFTYNGKSYVTPGPLQDMNDMVRLEVKPGVRFTIEIDGQAFTHVAATDGIYILQMSEEGEAP